VLDLMLPGEDGLSICRRLRAANDRTPIIMLTAKVEDVDRIVGLEVGADDYLPKPFNPRELLARIHAVLRRRPPRARARRKETVTFGPFEFDLALRRLTKDGEQMPLTTGEFSMLKALVRHPRQPLSRDKLAQLARGREFEPFDRSLDVQISRLRKMIEPDPASRATSRRCGAWATCSCRTARLTAAAIGGGQARALSRGARPRSPPGGRAPAAAMARAALA
jgi:two-component system phosphate regulon response regulator OmpR